jgi:cytochrome c5
MVAKTEAWRNWSSRLAGAAIVLALAATTAAAQGAAAGAGQAVFTANCAMCHSNISPKIGDKDAWAPRIAKGVPALLASVTGGKGAMPPRGGHPTLSDADIQSAIEYIVSQSK